MVVTPLYAGIIGLFLVVLSARVILLRRHEGVSLGFAGNMALERRIRAQGNLAEYGPLVIILIGTLELSGVAAEGLHGLGISFVVGRLLHGWALSFTEGVVLARVVGMVLTLAIISILATLNLLQALNVLD